MIKPNPWNAPNKIKFHDGPCQIPAIRNTKKIIIIILKKLTFFLKLNQSNVFLTTCEYLIANKGNILISNDQLKNYKLNELPINIIVFSSINQIVNDVSEGMSKLKNKYKNKVPSNITTLKPKKLIEENDFLSYGNSAKNIYLLLQDE